MLDVPYLGAHVRKVFASLVLFVLALVYLAPLAVLVQFHADRAYIEQELCVQREVMAEMRTCHGECQLSKRFQALERSAQQEFPTDKIQSRFEPKAPLAEAQLGFAATPVVRSFPEVVGAVLERVIPAAEPVPWA